MAARVYSQTHVRLLAARNARLNSALKKLPAAFHAAQLRLPQDPALAAQAYALGVAVGEAAALVREEAAP